MSLRIDTETRYEKTITIVPTLVGSNRNSVCNFIKNPLYYKEGMVDFCISERNVSGTESGQPENMDGFIVIVRKEDSA